VLGQAGARRVLAGSATGGDQQAVAEILQAACAAVDGVADVPFSHRIADAYVHASNSRVTLIRDA
jgi:hypothetical protein